MIDITHSDQTGAGIKGSNVRIGPAVVNYAAVNKSERSLGIAVIVQTSSGQTLPTILLPLDAAAKMLATFTHSMDMLLKIAQRTDERKAIELRATIAEMLEKLQKHPSNGKTVEDLISELV